MRYFIELSYKGTRYHGWQVQANSNTVQQEVNSSLSTILRLPIVSMASGRTDTGVHARQQVCHFDFEGEIDTNNLIKRVNSILPRDISVNAIRQVKRDAHARFDALWRSYQYLICLRKNPFEENLSWHCFYRLDREKMNRACELLLPHRDFQSFSKVKTKVNHYLCEIKSADWEQKDQHLIFHITANRFLRGMVRAMVGTMVEIGTGKLDLIDFQEILEKRKRSAAKSAAPAEGLYLSKVVYPDNIYI